MNQTTILNITSKLFSVDFSILHMSVARIVRKSISHTQSDTVDLFEETN